MKVESLIQGRKVVRLRDVVVDGVCVNVSLSRTKDGKLLYVIGTHYSPQELAGCYKKRRAIETFFQAGKKQPVKVKNHGYPQYSVFRRGINYLREFFQQKVMPYLSDAVMLAEQRLLRPDKFVG